MGAFTIAFDNTIVGALALPWVILVILLLFFEGNNFLAHAVAWVKQPHDLVLKWTKALKATVIAGILLFAVAYTLGSAVSRIAADFFSDGDLYLQVGGELLRFGTSEDRIIASVYCDASDHHLLVAGPNDPVLAAKISDFNQQVKWCPFALTWAARFYYDPENYRLGDVAEDLFGLQENALLLKGQDATFRLHQLHDQIMVLRGATFDGIVTFCFCMFAWGMALQRKNGRSIGRWILAVFPGVVLAMGGLCLFHHYHERFVTDPPYMEFSLLIIGFSGAWLLWRRPPRPPASDKTNVNSIPPARLWPILSLVFAVLSLGGMFGWWSTEVFYAQQVIYSYDAPPAPAAQ